MYLCLFMSCQNTDQFSSCISCRTNNSCFYHSESSFLTLFIFFSFSMHFFVFYSYFCINKNHVCISIHPFCILCKHGFLFFYFRICPFPKIIYFVVVSASSPIGPLACNFCVLIPISAPNPNSNPSVNLVDALTYTAAASISS